MAFIPVIDEERCRSCEECVDNCTAGVLGMRDGTACVLHPEHCQGCETCVEVCDAGAVTITRDTRHALSETCASLFDNLPE